MDIQIRIESEVKEDVELVVASLQEKFPNWKFHQKGTFVLYRKDVPEGRKPHDEYSATVYITSKDQVKGQ